MQRRIGLMCALLLLGSCGSEEPAAPLTTVEAFMADPQALERGQALFLGSCANFCHSLIVEDPDVNDAAFLFDCDWQSARTDDEIFEVVTTGIPNTRMVGFGNNFPEGDDDLWKIIAYIRANQDACGQ